MVLAFGGSCNSDDEKSEMKSLILFSGGIDSAVCAYGADNPLLVCFDYGQAHYIEIRYAEAIAKRLELNLIIEQLPKVSKPDGLVYSGRNLLLISAAIPIAVAHGVSEIIIGCNKSDADNFPDCRPEFVRAVNEVLEAGDYGVVVKAPLIKMEKKQVIELAGEVGLNLAETWSCYNPQDSKPCGECLACQGRQL